MNALLRERVKRKLIRADTSRALLQMAIVFQEQISTQNFAVAGGKVILHVGDQIQLREYMDAFNADADLPTRAAEIGYIAKRRGKSWVLASAKIWQVGGEPTPVIGAFVSANIRAGRHQFNLLGTDIESFLNSMFESGTLRFPEGDVIFNRDGTSPYSLYVDPLHYPDATSGRRISKLLIRGEKNYGGPNVNILNWELKAAPTPYDDIHELATIFGAGDPTSSESTLEVVAHEVVSIGKNSKISKGRAEISICIPLGTNVDDARIGYRIRKSGQIIERKSLSANDLQWKDHPDVRVGTGEIEFPVGAAMHCIACFREVAHHEVWLVDDDASENPRRVIYEAFDPALEVLQGFLNERKGKGRDGPSFEAAMAWLFWILGFNPVALGGFKKMQDGPDAIVQTPDGNVVVLECTTGLLKVENKVANLASRALAVRAALNKAESLPKRVLAVIASSLTYDEVAAEIPGATESGVLVMTHEDIVEALVATLQFPSAEIRFATMWRKLQIQKSNSRTGTGGIDQF